MTKIFHKIATLCFILSLSFVEIADAKPVLVFDNGFDWKQVFDAGFRPRHASGGRIFCRVWDQEPFAIQIKGLEGQMNFGQGRLNFYFDSNERLRSISHFSEEKFDMAEGQRRVDAMTEWLKPHIIHHMQMPKYIEGTYVDAGTRGSVLVAQMGEYRISYHFINTRRPDKQLMAEFSIGWAFPGKPTEGFIPLDRIIKPPPGYEDWDMTEIIPTSNGDKRVEDTAVTPVTKIPPDSPNVPRKERDRQLTSPPAGAEIIKQKPFFSVGIIMGLLAVIVSFLYASKQRRKK